MCTQSVINSLAHEDISPLDVEKVIYTFAYQFTFTSSMPPSMYRLHLSIQKEEYVYLTSW